ncbi:SDR family oxidoreductase [Actinoplanes sp. M2I2]|uniref:SDR family oxidoreductase n=1 Tax=Actinoplanes sp. M2I2 TaxID=1734444 RepID=UPI00201FEFA4|nr:NAD(P)H-binding protein [Actinoplanes sp. M2I2]
MTTSTVLVTGAGGVLGSVTVPRLTAAGHEVRAMSRRARPGWFAADLRTGEGIDEAVRGADLIVHLASAPGDARRTDVGGTRRLVAAARKAGVRHLVYVSIIGVDRVPLRYYRAKLATEDVVRTGGIPYTIVRASQFHPFAEGLLKTAGRLGPLILDPGFLAQPVDAAEVADRIADLLTRPAADAIVEFAGPRVLTLADASATWLAARGEKRRVLRLRLPGRVARSIRAGGLTTTATPTGTRTWEDYLAARY